MEPNWALAGELLLAASGLWPTRPLDRRVAAAALTLPKEWAAELTKLMTGAPATKPARAPAVKFLATWRRLIAAEDGSDLTTDQLAAEIISPEIAGAYKDVRKRALQYLQDEWGPVVVDDLQGSRLLGPSLSHQLRANQLVAVVGNPGRVVYHLRAGVVAPLELEALRAVYPATNELLSHLYNVELKRQREARASYRIPWSAEVVLRVLLGVPLGVAPPAEAEAEARAAAEPPSIEIRREREDVETRTDRVTDLGP